VGTVKAALFYGGRDIRVEELPDPTPGPGEVLVDVGAAGVCGSDLHPYRGADPWGGQVIGPRRAGHELAGVVVALGPGVSHVEVGQRVGVEPMHLVGCGACRQCHRGDYHVCPMRGLRNGQRHASAGFSELDLVVAENVYPLPDSISLDAASLLDVYGCGVHAINRIPLRASEYVCVVGTGPIGLTMGQVARAAGARRVIMIGRRDEPLQLALRVGAADAVVNNSRVASVGEAIADLPQGELCDAVFETVGGDEDTIAQAVEAAAFGGRIGIIGAFWGDVAVAYRAANRKELDLRWCNSYSTWHGVREFQIALDLLTECRVQAEPLITHRFPLSEIRAAFAAADDKRASGAVKVLIQP
jgi:2-desacetyl-2-hydroxyethyl bacteriochlorophyllide A dehydrogenase